MDSEKNLKYTSLICSLTYIFLCISHKIHTSNSQLIKMSFYHKMQTHRLVQRVHPDVRHVYGGDVFGPALLRSRPGCRVGQAGGCLVKGSFLFLFVRHRVWRRWRDDEALLQTGIAKKVRTEANQNFLFPPSKDIRPEVFESHVCLVFFHPPISCHAALLILALLFVFF